MYLVVQQVNSTSLIHCSSTKIHNNPYKNVYICESDHIEITAPPVH